MLSERRHLVLRRTNIYIKTSFSQQVSKLARTSSLVCSHRTGSSGRDTSCQARLRAPRRARLPQATTNSDNCNSPAVILCLLLAQLAAARKHAALVVSVASLVSINTIGRRFIASDSVGKATLHQQASEQSGQTSSCPIGIVWPVKCSRPEVQKCLAEFGGIFLSYYLQQASLSRVVESSYLSDQLTR